MTALTLEACRTIADTALATGREKGMKPLGIVIVDARGAVRLTLVEDGNALLRADIAHGKAFGCVAVGVGGRTLERMAKERPHFMGALGGLSRDRLPPVPGGVLIRDAAGTLARTFLDRVPSLRAQIVEDVQAAYDGDPAARDLDEIILASPGLLAGAVYRYAHELS